jgi:hypothetical protein
MRLACLCLATSCAEDVRSAQDDERREREAALEDLSATFCARVEECECAAGGSATGCTGFESDIWRARLNVGDDRELTWDAECVDAITSAVATAGCEEAPLGLAHPCHEYCAVFHGEREIGESCKGFDELVSDCAQGLLCSAGRCVEPCTVLSGGQVGEPCDDPGDAQEFGACAQGLFCDAFVDRCAVPPPLGSACEDFDLCGPDAFCDWNSSTCRALPGLGDSCWESPQCAQGLACQNAPDYGSATCVQPAGADEECRDRPCADGLSCDFNDVCRPPGDVGQRCDGVGCREGLLCDPDLGYVCREPPGVGQSCFSGVCTTDAWCDFNDPVEPTCVAAAANGEACTGHSRCTSGYCPAGWCEARPDLGEDCSELFICASGLFCDGSTCRQRLTALPAVCEYEGW